MTVLDLALDVDTFARDQLFPFGADPTDTTPHKRVVERVLCIVHWLEASKKPSPTGWSGQRGQARKFKGAMNAELKRLAVGMLDGSFWKKELVGWKEHVAALLALSVALDKADTVYFTGVILEKAVEENDDMQRRMLARDPNHQRKDVAAEAKWRRVNSWFAKHADLYAQIGAIFGVLQSAIDTEQEQHTVLEMMASLPTPPGFTSREERLRTERELRAQEAENDDGFDLGEVATEQQGKPMERGSAASDTTEPPSEEVAAAVASVDSSSDDDDPESYMPLKLTPELFELMHETLSEARARYANYDEYLGVHAVRCHQAKEGKVGFPLLLDPLHRGASKTWHEIEHMVAVEQAHRKTNGLPLLVEDPNDSNYLKTPPPPPAPAQQRKCSILLEDSPDDEEYKARELQRKKRKLHKDQEFLRRTIHSAIAQYSDFLWDIEYAGSTRAENIEYALSELQGHWRPEDAPRS